jgi:tetratricopeptide (TPR) repeat protein
MIWRMMTRWLPILAIVMVAGGPLVAQQADGNTSEEGLPAGLSAFLKARLLESEDRYREALIAYDQALGEDPSILEVRVGFANLLFRVGMVDRAVEVLEGVEDLDWHGRRVYALALAQLSVQQPDRMTDAESALHDVLDERDDDPNLLLALGQLLHRMNRIEEAEAAIAQLREDRSGSAQLVSYHATLLRQLGRNQEAAELFVSCAGDVVTAVNCRENAVELLMELDRPGEAADLMLEWLGDDDLDQLMRAGYLLWEAGRPAQALQVVDRVLREVPDSERGRTLKAHLLSAVGRYPEAIRAFRSLLKANPADFDLQMSMAWAVARSGDLDEARRWIDRAWEQAASDAGSQQAVRCAVTGARIELLADNPLVAREWLTRVADPKDAGEEYVRLLGESYRREGDWADGISSMVRIQPRVEGNARLAAEAIEAEFRLRSSDRRAWQRLRPLLDSDRPETVVMGLQVLQGVERWSDAEREAAAALERMPGDRDILFARAASLERLGRFDEAESAFLELLESDPRDATAANYLGYLWADRDMRLDEALELVNRAVAADPENPAYLDSLGWVHFRLGAIDQAEFWLRRAIEHDDGDGTLRAHLGEVLLARGEIEEGSRLLRLALDLGCEHPDHVRSLLDGLSDAPPQ